MTNPTPHPTPDRTPTVVTAFRSRHRHPTHGNAARPQLIRVITPIMLAVLLLSGCSMPRGGGSATSDIGGCAAVLPIARDTVHGHGTLTLVHRFGRDDAAALYAELGVPPVPPPTPDRQPHATPATPPTGPRPPKTCLVIYQGDYPAGTVTGADPNLAGRYALIIVRVRHPLVYRVLLTNELPSHLPGS